MVTDEDLISFMQAVYDIGQRQGWRAHAEQIMPRIGLEPSSVVDIRKPTTDDARIYTDLAQRCEAMGYISSRANSYVLVRITEEGKYYVESDFTAV